MHRPARLSLAVLLALLALLPPVGVAPAAAQVQDGATLTVLRGQVAVVHPDGSAVQPAPSGTIVKAGDEIRTVTRTGALITFFAGTEIEMGEDTILVVETVSVNGARVDISLKQVFGTTLNRVQSLTDPNASYRIDAGGATAVVRGTTFLLIGPVATSAGNVAALICLDDCDARTTFSGCPVAPFSAFGVTVEKSRVTSGCETTSVERDADYFNAGFEAVTAFEQTFAAANDGTLNPGTGNLGREEGQRRADARNEREDREDPPVVAQLRCQVPSGPGFTPSSPILVPGTAQIFEGNAGGTTLSVPVSLFPASTDHVTVHFATGGGSATPGVDYTPTSGTLTFPPGSTSQLVPITILGDLTIEPDETVNITFSNASGATLIAPLGVGTILDDDGPIEARLLDAFVVEGNAGVTQLVHQIVLSRTSPTPLTFLYESIPGGTATPGLDFVAAPPASVATVPANSIAGSLSIPVVGDTQVEPNETALVRLTSGPGGTTIVDDTATGTIVDDDGPATIAISGGSAPEGCESTTPLTFHVQLTRPLPTPVTVNFTTADGTAQAGSDYQGASGTVTFMPGHTLQTITVLVNGDEDHEGNETFQVNLSGAVGAAISIPTATGTIIDDD